MIESNWPEIPGYRIDRELGRGGMATVYLGVQESLDRQVAIKVMKAALSADDDFAERFVREARTAASLQHSGIVGIFDAGNVGHNSYIAMEYVPGEDLKARLRQGALDEGVALAILGQLADALDYAHAEGFVHRDVKPENILFRKNGHAVLTDFGIARAIGAGTRMTATGLSIGTPHYMSPEQARGKDVDGRSDLYALGVVFHEMLTGKVPFDAQDSFAVGLMHINDPLPRLPPELHQYQPILEKMLAKDPGDRYQNGRDLIADLEVLAAGERIRTPHRATRTIKRASSRKAGSPALSTSDQEQPTPGASPWKWATGGALLAVVMATGLYLWQDQSRTPIGGGTTAIYRPATSPAAEATTPEIVSAESRVSEEPTLIKSIQNYLNRLGYRVPLSGELDARTQAGIRAFEDVRELLVTGVADEILQAALIEAYRELDDAAWEEAREQDTESGYFAYAKTHPQGRHVEQVEGRLEVLREQAAAEEERGREQEAMEAQRRERISAIQSELRRLGRPVEVDGVFGPATADQIRNFERGANRTERGEATDQLLAALRNADRWPGPQPGDMFRDCPDCPEMVVIPAGRFTMGSPSSEPERRDNEGPQRQINVPGFALGKYAVTFAEWDACVADGGCTHRPRDQGWGRGTRPVINVNWNDAQEYVQWLSRKTGETYRLASETEWEYAARAGTTTRFNTGNCITTGQANFRGTNPAQGCPAGEYRQRTVPVGSFDPNAFALYDMHGNVWEWVQDCWNGSYNVSPTDGSAWMRGNCDHAVLRGGSWSSYGLGVRSAYRLSRTRGTRNSAFGFRVARSVSF